MKTKCRTNQFLGVSGPRQTYLISVANSKNDTKDVMAVEWATPLSIRPPLFGISISPNKHTYGLIKTAGVFTVNVPSADIVRETYWAGTHTGRRYKDKIAKAGLTSNPGKTDVNAVSIDEAIASFECKVVDEIKVGNHVLFVGEVLSVNASEDLFDIEKGAWYPERLRNIYRVAYKDFVTNSSGVLSMQ
ncbi:MAG: flavin reductase family protein [Candidatus Thorarchaeota archaeon]